MFKMATSACAVVAVIMAALTFASRNTIRSLTEVNRTKGLIA
jgi:hypothetical protein